MKLTTEELEYLIILLSKDDLKESEQIEIDILSKLIFEYMYRKKRGL